MKRIVTLSFIVGVLLFGTVLNAGSISQSTCNTNLNLGAVVAEGSLWEDLSGVTIAITIVNSEDTLTRCHGVLI